LREEGSIKYSKMIRNYNCFSMKVVLLLALLAVATYCDLRLLQVPSNNTLTPCSQDSDCSGLELCALDFGLCLSVGCVNDSDCASGEICNSFLHTCIIPACTNDTDCSIDEFCFAPQGACFSIECTVDFDCP